MVRLGRQISLWKADERDKLLSHARPLWKSPHFDIRVLPKQGMIARLVVITPKKVGSAPYRNLLKRRTRSIFYQEKLFESRNDWVIYFRPSKSILTYKTLHSKLLELFKHHG